jgi:hypothetical protein
MAAIDTLGSEAYVVPEIDHSNLHPYIVGKTPVDLAKSYNTKKNLWKVAAVVSFVASCFFTTATVALFSASSFGLPLILVTLSIAVPIFSSVFSKMYHKSNHYNKLKNLEESVAREFKILEQMPDDEIRNFLKCYEIDPSITEEKLKQINPSYTIRNIIPALSYLSHHNIRAAAAAAQEGIRSILKNKNVDENIRLAMLNHTHKLKEEVIYPSKLSAAETIFIMQNPTSYQRIFTHGSISPKSFTHRYLLSIFDNEDKYFIFNPEFHEKEALSTKEIKKLEPYELAQIIFK